jgi:primosomal protein N' (replication factor Y)
LNALLPFQSKGYPTVAQVAREARVPQHVFSELAQAGWVELFDLLPAQLPPGRSPHTLSPGQSSAVNAVRNAIQERQHRTFLLFGVTGSGKTEVYLRLMEQVILEGGTALYLVPEISLASFLARRLLERLGSAVAILHSSMTEHERVRQWLRAASGSARAVIGPRSALFAPLPNLRLIVADEEHDPSYKQQDFPRYHARDMAVLRGQRAGIPVVLGSATPSVESYYNATEVGKYHLLRLPERAGEAHLPPVEVVDMRREFKERAGTHTLSRTLAEALGETLAQGRQAVILRNRLGFATFVLCRQCGRTVQCPDCSVAFTFHRKVQRLKCHYCGRQAPVPVECPSCGGEVLQFLGEGTEKVEDALAESYPGARVARMDRDAVKTGRDFDRIWRDFEGGRIGILAGTQMVAKGHDIPNVTLVGILSADFILGMPDFRSAERTFQLITQAAGRAGRGEHPGQVILQSYHPDHYAVQAAREHDFVAFYEKDVRYRKMVGYPPASALARVELRHKDRTRAEALAHEAWLVVKEAKDFQLRILGPVEAPLARLEGHWRIHILLRGDSRSRLRAVLVKLLDSPLGRHSGREMLVEIDPYNLM